MRVRHYKGGEYTVLGDATDSETGEPLVLYRAESTGRLWVRPTVIFWGTVEVEGAEVLRFAVVPEQAG